LIKYFTVENFHSIKTENILEFDSGIGKNCEYDVHPVIAFAGANASGKTTILRAITFVLWFMQHSFFGIRGSGEIPFEPFHTLRNSPTKFHLIFSMDTPIQGEYKAVDYEYKLCLTEEQVLIEEFWHYPYERKRMVYARSKNNLRLGNSISHITTKDLRKNCSVISFAAQFNSQTVAKTCKKYDYHSNLLDAYDRYDLIEEDRSQSHIIKKLLKNERLREKAQKLLKIADVGIEDIYLKEQDETEKKFLQRIEEGFEDTDENETFLEMLRDLKTGRMTGEVIREPCFRHSIDEGMADFDIELESSGTLRFLEILYRVLTALEKGSLLILDEIEVKLHQDLTAYLIGLFENPLENRNRAQLIFSFHNSSLMEVLEPDQLWFAEKNDRGRTKFFSANDFKDIGDLHKKKLEKLYRIGRFGAKPRGI